MSNTIKIDPRAFSRGVDEVLLMKPVRRVVVSIMQRRDIPKATWGPDNVKPKKKPVAKGRFVKHD